MSVIATLRKGITAKGTAHAATKAKTPRVTFSLWLETTEPLLGITYRFRPITLIPGSLRVNKRAAEQFLDITQELTFPRFIVEEASSDWGGTVASVKAPLPPGLHRIARFDVTWLGSKPKFDTTFALDPISMVALVDDGEQFIGASFQIQRL